MLNSDSIVRGIAMKYKVMAVMDRAVEGFGTPIFVRSVGEGERSFSDEVNRSDDNNQLNKHPEHFDLFLLGSYDSDSGFIDSLTIPTLVCTGNNCLKVVS
jgi:hypothetical protein